MMRIGWGATSALVMIFVVGVACGGGDASDGDSVGDGDGDLNGDGDSTGRGDGDGDGDSTGDGDGDGDSPGDGDGDGDDRVSESCGERATNLPERSGATISVSPAAAAGSVLVDGSETTLRSVVSEASEGDTILLEDGTYSFNEAGQGEFTGLYFTTGNLTLRGASGDASQVILDSAYSDHGGSSGVISVDAPGVVLADFTVQRSIFHLIHLWESGDDAIIHNVTMIDGGQQFLKASPGSGTVDGAEVSCSRFLMTDEGRDNVWGYGDQDGWTTCYTGGIDTHNSRNWHVHDSYFEGIYCDTDPGRPAHGKKGEDRGDQTYGGGLSEHAIHMWDSESGSGHMIERNQIVDCARGIGLGLQEPVYGSTVRNNVISSMFSASREHDVGIIVERGVDILVAHNTLYFGAENAYPNPIEIRWGETSGVTVHGNLATGPTRLRDDAAATETDNVTDATFNTFYDVNANDFNLANCGEAVTVTSHPEVTKDFSGADRGDAPHAGAYQCR